MLRVHIVKSSSFSPFPGTFTVQRIAYALLTALWYWLDRDQKSVQLCADVTHETSRVCAIQTPVCQTQASSVDLSWSAGFCTTISVQQGLVHGLAALWDKQAQVTENDSPTGMMAFDALAKTSKSSFSACRSSWRAGFPGLLYAFSKKATSKSAWAVSV